MKKSPSELSFGSLYRTRNSIKMLYITQLFRLINYKNQKKKIIFNAPTDKRKKGKNESDDQAAVIPHLQARCFLFLQAQERSSSRQISPDIYLVLKPMEILLLVLLIVSAPGIFLGVVTTHHEDTDHSSADSSPGSQPLSCRETPE